MRETDGEAAEVWSAAVNNRELVGEVLFVVFAGLENSDWISQKLEGLLAMNGMVSPLSCSLGSYLFPDDAWMARVWHFRTFAFIADHWSHFSTFINNC